MEYTEEQKKEILEAAAYLKSKNYREETNFSLYSTAALMVEYSRLKPVEIPEISDDEIDARCDKTKITYGINPAWAYVAGAKWYRSELKKRMTK